MREETFLNLKRVLEDRGHEVEVEENKDIIIYPDVCQSFYCVDDIIGGTILDSLNQSGHLDMDIDKCNTTYYKIIITERESSKYDVWRKED